ncbi:hypothetical protein QR685DRAFT_590433 [Neurospora intermedia]|uniref:Transmembrane protein n=1 Tax=Neurospora intermedia TaxID=5142 RepID=A0ABR3D936_NEUIN
MFLFLELDMEVPNEDFGHIGGGFAFPSSLLVPFGVYLSICPSFGLSRNIFIFNHWSSNHYLGVLLFCCCSCGVCWLLQDTCMPFPRYSGRTGFFLRVLAAAFSFASIRLVITNIWKHEDQQRGFQRGKEKPSYFNEVDWKKRTPK